MNIKIAKIFPEENEDCKDLYYRMCENMEFYIKNHPELTINISYNIKEGSVMVKTLNMEYSIN